MEKVDMICYTWVGARDLHAGIPDLEGAVIEKVTRENDIVCTTLHMKLKDGRDYKMAVCPQE